MNLVTEDLNQVRHIILNSIQATNNCMLLDAIITHINTARGKLLRPTLLLIFAKIFNANKQDSIILAATIELIHIASLLHDDVLDQASTRRCQHTINHQYGNQLAILAGDFIYTKALQLMQEIKHHNKPQVFSIINNAVSLMLEGEILQLSEKNNINITQAQYLKIITNKTAKLFSAAVEISSIISDQQHYNINHLLNFGLNFGIYYQLINDIEDYYKSGNDIVQGRITLPLIFVLSKNVGLTDLINKPVNKIRTIISDYGGFTYTKQLAQQYISKAKKHVNCLLKELKFQNNEYQQIIADIIAYYDDCLIPVRYGLG